MVKRRMWSVMIILLLQRKAAKGMGMMRSPSTASLATGGPSAVLTHKVRVVSVYQWSHSSPNL